VATADVASFFDEQYRNHARYWWRGKIRYSADPRDYPQSAMTRRMLDVVHRRGRGRVLDVGAGEGSDAIRLALLGYEVDAVEVSAVGAEKIERFARENRARVNVVNADVMKVELSGPYDIVICNGVLHYVMEKAALLRRLQRATAPGGWHFVSLFSDHTPLPACHRVVDAFCDREDGVTVAAYERWRRAAVWAERDRLETSHPGFEAHRHSFIKLIAQRPAEARGPAPAVSGAALGPAERDA